jgi:acetyltransferase-like isoleucine patch superfamily enzyme
MFSTDIHMDVSDMHPIYDRATGERINPARAIHIGDHVWLGTRVLVNKGARIGEGAVIGAGSMVAGQIPPHTLAVGTPARVVRENIAWRREFDEVFVPEPAQRTAAQPRRGWLERLRSRIGGD